VRDQGVRPAHLRHRGHPLRTGRARHPPAERPGAQRGHLHLPVPRTARDRQRQGAVPGLCRGLQRVDGPPVGACGGPAVLRHPDPGARGVRLARPAARRPRRGHQPRPQGHQRARRGGGELAHLGRRQAARVLRRVHGLSPVPGALASHSPEIIRSTDTAPPVRAARPARARGKRGASRPAPRRDSLASRLRRDRTLILMALPMVVLLLIFAYIPILGNVIAFQDYSPFIGIRDSPWLGMQQFERVIADPLFWNAVKNTLVITAFQLVFYFPIPIALAILLNSVLSEKVRTVIQSIVYLPHFFSWVVV